MSVSKKQLDAIESEVKNQLLSSNFATQVIEALKPKLLEILKPIVQEAITQALTESLRPIVQDVNSSQGRIAELEATVKELKQEIAKTTSQANDNEQYSRRMCLRLFGVPEEHEVSRHHVVNLLNSALSVQLSEGDIDRTHRTGRTNDERPRGIIIKFSSYSARHKVWSNKSKFKGSRMVVSEDLTKFNLELLKHAKQKEGIYAAWSNDGRIFLKRSRDGPKIKISSLKDIIQE